MKMFLCIVSSLCCANIAPAKIGENEFQIENRYGKAVEQWEDYLGPRKLYRWKGYDVTVNYVMGTSQRERFAKTGDAFDLSFKERAKLSRLAGAGKKGIIIIDEGGDGVLTVTTKQFEEEYEAVGRAAWEKSKSARQ